MWQRNVGNISSETEKADIPAAGELETFSEEKPFFSDYRI